MSDIATMLGKEIFNHQMTKGDLLEAQEQIKSLEADLAKPVDISKVEKTMKLIMNQQSERLQKLEAENKELRKHVHRMANELVGFHYDDCVFDDDAEIACDCGVHKVINEARVCLDKDAP